MNYDDTLPLVSIHIPKTGGSSFLLILREWFGPDRVHVHYPGERLTHIPEGLSGGDCIHGHFNAARGFRIDDVISSGGQFITFLRDPFERFVSQWSFIHRGVRNEEACLGDEAVDHFRNWMGLRAAEQKEGRNSWSLIWHFPQKVREKCSLAEIERHFVFIGEMARYEASVSALASRLNKPVPTVPFVNAWLKDKSMFESYRPEFEECFADEIDLYQACLEFARTCPEPDAQSTPRSDGAAGPGFSTLESH